MITVKTLNLILQECIDAGDGEIFIKMKLIDKHSITVGMCDFIINNPGEEIELVNDGEVRRVEF